MTPPEGPLPLIKGEEPLGDVLFLSPSFIRRGGVLARGGKKYHPHQPPPPLAASSLLTSPPLEFPPR